MKNFFALFILILFFQSCGYAPMYSKNQKVDFYIENIEFDGGDRDLSLLIESKLKKYLVNNQGNKFIIKSSINYQKNSLSKSSTGETLEYELSANVKFEVYSDLVRKEFVIREKFKMNNYADEFEEMKYERTVKENIARLITSKLIIQLSRFDVN